jgi:ABC-type Na+ efflux pump permease subunit
VSPLLVPALARWSWRQTLRSRRFAMACLVSAIPVLLGIALLFADEPDPMRRLAGPDGGPHFEAAFAEPVSLLVLGGTVPFVALLLAGGLLADEVEDRTLSYLLVRPIRRRQLYLSRLVPVAALGALLAVVQVLLFGLLRLLSWSIHGAGSVQQVYLAGDQAPLGLMGTGAYLAAAIPLGAAAAVLAALAFTALFGFVSLLTTRYHFVANLLVLGFVELLFGNLGGRGAGVLTVTYHAHSLLYAFGPPSAHYHPAPWWLAVPVLLAFAAFWSWLATWQAARRDFNVTSAAS